MIESELLRFMREEIGRQLNVLLPGVSQNSTQSEKGSVEDIANMFPGMDVIQARPVVQTYGVVSRSPAGTPQVVGRMGSHTGNRMVMGHRDSKAPTVPEEGATILYSKNYRIRVLNGQIQVGKGSTFETVVVGDTLQSLLEALIDLIVAHTHAAPGAPPTNAAAFSTLKTNQVSNGKILAKDGGRF